VTFGAQRKLGHFAVEVGGEPKEKNGAAKNILKG